MTVRDDYAGGWVVLTDASGTMTWSSVNGPIHPAPVPGEPRSSLAHMTNLELRAVMLSEYSETPSWERRHVWRQASCMVCFDISSFRGGLEDVFVLCAVTPAPLNHYRFIFSQFAIDNTRSRCV